MKELIFKQDAINQIMSVPDGNWKSERYAKEIEKMPAVQPEIIKCKDCAWGMTGDFSKKFFCSLTGALAWAEPDSFCSHAVRKINGSD